MPHAHLIDRLAMGGSPQRRARGARQLRNRRSSWQWSGVGGCGDFLYRHTVLPQTMLRRRPHRTFYQPLAATNIPAVASMGSLLWNSNPRPPARSAVAAAAAAAASDSAAVAAAAAAAPSHATILTPKSPPATNTTAVATAGLVVGAVVEFGGVGGGTGGSGRAQKAPWLVVWLSCQCICYMFRERSPAACLQGHMV